LKINAGKLLIGGLGALLAAPVLYSVIMAFVPEKSTSLVSTAPQASNLSGEELYSKCAPCHGSNGDGTDAYPPLNTLSKGRMVEMLNGFQQGSYGSANNKKIMQVQVQGMSKEDMGKIAEFVTQLKPNVKSKEEIDSMRKKKKDQQTDITGISS
jgi:cytochrome c553